MTVAARSRLSSTPSQPKAPIIFDYTELRPFLRAHFAYKQKIQKNWSYGVWARKLKLSNTSVLSNIISGKRKPGKSVTEKLVTYFAFSAEEKNYFNILVRIHDLGDSSSSLNVLKRIKDLSKEKSFSIDLKTFEVISEWKHYVLREIVNLKNFHEDPQWIRDRLREPLSLHQIQTGVDTLLEKNLLSRTPARNLMQTPEWIETPNDFSSKALKIFHESMIRMALKSLRHVPVELRDITGTTFNIKKTDLPKIKKRIREFRKALCSEFESSPQEGEETYQLNVQFFPMTHSD